MLNNLIPYILSLPIVLLALSVHEVSHGYVAYKLGDPTAKSLGRLNLNPISHIDPLGFLCMIFFRFGWAKPVPINTRYFKKPRRDMALSAAAGPLSNILLSILFALLLKIEVVIVEKFFAEDVNTALSIIFGASGEASSAFVMLSILAYILFMGVLLNISLAIFNLIPIPPFDGSRIFYVFLPVKLYFKVMKYERVIMLVILALMAFTPLFDGLISAATSGLASLVMKIFAIEDHGSTFFTLIQYVTSSLIS